MISVVILLGSRVGLMSFIVNEIFFLSIYNDDIYVLFTEKNIKPSYKTESILPPQVFHSSWLTSVISTISTSHKSEQGKMNMNEVERYSKHNLDYK